VADHESGMLLKTIRALKRPIVARRLGRSKHQTRMVPYVSVTRQAIEITANVDKASAGWDICGTISGSGQLSHIVWPGQVPTRSRDLTICKLRPVTGRAAGPLAPLTPVTNGLPRSLADSPPRRSGHVTGPDGTASKLIVRVRYVPRLRSRITRTSTSEGRSTDCSRPG
jgi:hypothetical protein